MEKARKMIGFLMLFIVSVLAGSMSVQAYERQMMVAEEEINNKYFAPGGVTDLTAAQAARAWRRINGVCYNGSGDVIEDAITRGIDVSEWQDTIDWKKVKNSDVDFAFVRISSGVNYIDKKYAYNMKEAESAGVPVGTYVYSTAVTPAQALAEAKLAIRMMDGYKVSYPVVYDLEYSKMAELSPTEISKLAVAFCDEIKKAGYYPMIYSNTNWYDNKIDWDVLKGVDMWLARYGDTILAPLRSKYKYTIWQCTDGDGGGILRSTKGLVDGIPIYNNIDLNFGYVDYTKIIQPRYHALSSYTPGEIDDSTEIKNGWIEENGNTYYYKNGKKYTGTRKIGKNYYCFNSKDGYLYRDKLLYSSTTKRYVYANSNGIRVKNQWVTYNGKKYYMGSDGTALKGSRKVGKYYYLFHSSKGYARTNSKVTFSDKSICYYDSEGRRCTNKFVTITEKGTQNTYYFGNNGKACTGLKKINGKWYYFYTNKTAKAGTMAKNATIKGSTGIKYVFGSDGVLERKYR